MTWTMAAAGAALVAVGGLRTWLWWRSRQWVIGERNGTKVIVRRRGAYRELVLEHGDDALVQSRQRIDNPLDAGAGYVDGLHVGMLIDPRPRSILFLGGGAGIAPRQFEATYPDVSIDVVEKDPLVVAAATRHFGLRITRKLSIHVADARKFVTDSLPEHYDLVVLDVYDAKSIPAHLTTPEFFASLRAVVTKEGALVANLARTATLDEDAIVASLKESFAPCEVRIFDAIENSIVLVASTIPPQRDLESRAAKIECAPHLAKLVATRER